MSNTFNPTKNLRDQRVTAKRILALIDGNRGRNPVDILGAMRENADELAVLVLALDEHLERGGELPATWRKAAR